MCAVGKAEQTWPAPDWARPWNAPFAEAGAAVRSACEQGVPLPQALTQRVGTAGPRFVPQTELPEAVAYERFIFDTGTVPTREGLHDFFNGLCWQRFPATKRLLNRLQAAEIQQAGVGQVRGPVRDAITLFDENAVLLQAPDALWDALVAREWTRLFVDLRPLWAQARLVLFGHALLEKLVAPYKSITGHVYREPVPLALGGDLGAWDAWLAARLTAAELGAKPFTPLPVLGVPGWCPANEDPAYYADAGVFRPRRVPA
ncbi:MAG: DUF3025 domain-containing protein [Hydrogenophaga sp.]|uniref:DUF3025 domain-containing protein n=1 Tax=Hydrogenophaga sp. TaxID=1904254 RepID=UPI0025C281F0|nr:DUF3025 domain-containing protein [Hydrogenophaga sp.]MBT9552708.1 DUF3025 domain-containing protein [Hydrogenophaga sp.]